MTSTKDYRHKEAAHSVSGTCRLNSEHLTNGGSRVERRAAFQEIFVPGIQRMKANTILPWLWVDKENHPFQIIEHRGFVGGVWLPSTIRPTSCLIDCREPATPAPWGRIPIIVLTCAASTRALDSIGSTTLW